MKQKFDGVGPSLSPSRTGGLRDELEGLAAEFVAAGTIEVRMVELFSPPLSNVFGAELEFGQRFIGFDGCDRVSGCLDIQSVHMSGLRGHGVLLFHGHSPLERSSGVAPAFADADGWKLGLDTARHQIEFGQERSFHANSWGNHLEIAPKPLEAIIVALPETAGSALYGMVDVLAATGTLGAN